jgi:hypothetical protein
MKGSSRSALCSHRAYTPPGAGRQRWAAVAVTPPGAAADAARCRVRPSRWSSDDSDKRLRAAAAPPSPPPSPARRHPSAPRVRHRPRSPPESRRPPCPPPVTVLSLPPSAAVRGPRPPPEGGPPAPLRPPPAPGPSAAGPPPAPSSTSPSVAPVRPLIPSVAHLCRPVRRLPHPPSWPPPTTANLVHHACDACTRHCGTPAGASK